MSSENDREVLIVPFGQTIIDVEKIVNKKISKNITISSFFKKIDRIKEFKKIYLPVLLVDVNIYGDANFLAMNRTKTNRYEVKTTINMDYHDVCIKLNSLIPNDLFDLCYKFDYSKIEESKISLNEDCLFLVDDVDEYGVSDKVLKDITNKSFQMIKESLPHELKRLNENKAITNINNRRFVYLPFYYLATNYKEKEYNVLINGVTGDMSSNISFDIKSTIVSFIIIFIIVFIISFLIAFFF